jgi:hypothetical protein
MSGFQEKSRGATSKLVIYHHDDCALHCIKGHPEQPMRVTFCIKELRKKYPDASLFKECPMATEVTIVYYSFSVYVIALIE